MITYPSKLVERAVEQLSSLPGIGRKSALRLALHLLSRSESEVRLFASTLTEMRDQIVYCQRCHNISDTDLCTICSNSARDASLLCVVQHVGDVMAIENTAQYRGLYHVLGGVISPIDGIGPDDLTIDALVERVREGEVKEVILALGTTMEGDTTNFFIHRSLSGLDVKITIISRGVAIGDEIEYADEVTLGRSILGRTDFEQSIRL
ncbi:MAG: recombination mediator RecR [Porphyromonadaceae bacterium]|nr:recombination mediator RecR [Porphyromonadaceae bacterium]